MCQALISAAPNQDTCMEVWLTTSTSGLSIWARSWSEQRKPVWKENVGLCRRWCTASFYLSRCCWVKASPHKNPPLLHKRGTAKQAGLGSHKWRFAKWAQISHLLHQSQSFYWNQHSAPSNIYFSDRPNISGISCPFVLWAVVSQGG